jgi:hypothetical protein
LFGSKGSEVRESSRPNAECLVTADKAFAYVAAVSSLRTKNWANDAVQTERIDLPIARPGRRFVPAYLRKSEKP